MVVRLKLDKQSIAEDIDGYFFFKVKINLEKTILENLLFNTS
jgi:hypothetical protein